MFGLFPRQREAPNLVALRFVVVSKPGAEAFKQVRLGHHHVNREADTQLFMQLRQPLAQVDRLLARGFRGERQQIGNADGDNDAVNRLAAAILTQQADKFQPLPGILNLLALLSGVAPRGVQQDGFVSEPPVAVAGAANAAQSGFTEAIRQRELQAGIDQRRGFTSARCADNDVPRQLVEILRTEALRPLGTVSRFAEVGFFSICAASSKRPARICSSLFSRFWGSAASGLAVFSLSLSISLRFSQALYSRGRICPCAQSR